MKLEISQVEQSLTRMGYPRNFSSLNKEMLSNIYQKALDKLEDFDYKNDLIKITQSIDDAKNLDDLKAKLNEISGKYRENAKYTEISTICDISINSYIHWTKNLGNWIDSSGAKKLPPKFTAIVRSDAEGAISGALGGIGFAGVGAIAGACIGHLLIPQLLHSLLQ